MHSIKIADRVVGTDQPCYFIAEIGLNHNGKIQIAKELISLAKSAGADAVKFQKRYLEEIYLPEILDNPLLGEQSIQYLVPALKLYRLRDEEFMEIADYCRKLDITFLCTPWDVKSLDFVVSLGVPALKISSADLTNVELLEAAVVKDLPLIISTGMASLYEVDKAVQLLKDLGARFSLLHCNSSYPAPFGNLNMRMIPKLRDRYDVPVGYSGHERGIAVSSAAVGLGACILERHFTLNRKMQGPDHAASLEPEELKRLVKDVRDVEASMGTGIKCITRGEVVNREVLGKSLVTAVDVPADTVMTRQMISVRSPGKGLSPLFLNDLVGRKTAVAIPKGAYLREKHFSGLRLERHSPKSDIPWGVVARFNDLDEMVSDTIRTVELHMTDKDLQSQFVIEKDYPQELVVHTPEYWGSSLLDLSSRNPELRGLAVDVFNRTIETARRIAPRFQPASERGIKVVIHPGGMSRDGLLDDTEDLNDNLRDSIGRLHRDGIDLLVENMPPVPWYFGGQWYHNSFMNAKEISGFCEEMNLGTCLDTSHAMLYLNAYGGTLADFARTVKHLVRHLHISDAQGVDGEGLQIGEGEIDFTEVMPILADLRCGFIAEIWQGHRFGGEGFWTAIERLEQFVPQRLAATEPS